MNKQQMENVSKLLIKKKYVKARECLIDIDTPSARLWLLEVERKLALINVEKSDSISIAKILITVVAGIAVTILTLAIITVLSQTTSNDALAAEVCSEVYAIYSDEFKECYERISSSS